MKRYSGLIIQSNAGKYILESRLRDGERIISTFGGAVEPNENFLSALRREAKEELGLTLSINKIHLFDETVAFKENHFVQCKFYRYNASINPIELVLEAGTKIHTISASELVNTKHLMTHECRRILLSHSRVISKRKYNPPNSWGDSEIASEYERSRSLTHNQADTWINIFSSIIKQYSETRISKAIDIGSGTGRLMPLFKFLTKGAEIIGIDSSKPMTDFARATGLNVQMADVSKLPFEAKQIDFGYTFLAWHHFANKRDAASEIARVLKSRSLFLVITTFYEKIDSLFLDKYFPSFLYIQKNRYPTETETLNAFQAAGFDFISSICCANPIAPSLEAYKRMVEYNAHSVLWKISRTERERGMLDLQNDIEANLKVDVQIPINIAVFRKR